MTEEHVAALIKDYWLSRGYAVSVSVRDVAIQTRAGVHHYRAVRSDMIHGLPRGYRDHTTTKLGKRAA